MLEEYNRKRRFDSTPEPPGRKSRRRRQSFVIQKHRASRLHYDFRLEMEGVLRSWAIPRGPSLDPREKRLAIATEDHPVDYGAFEGVIPPGNYGAGEVIIWDRGTYEMVDPRTPAEGWRRKKFHIVLRGGKLAGEWVLVKTGSGEKEWLFFKVEDHFASEHDITAERPESVVSGLTLGEIAAPGESPRRWYPEIEREMEALGVKEPGPSPMPERIDPMLAMPEEGAIRGSDWLYEIKLDGVRAIARKERGRVRILSRNRKSLGDRFPVLVDAIRTLHADSAILDGELVVFDPGGRTRFSLIQPRIHARPVGEGRDETAAPAYFAVFDLLYLNGFDLRDQPLVVRKALLGKLIPNPGWIRYTEHVEGDGAAFFEAAGAHGLEGIVAKRKQSRYQEGRSREWRKIKTTRTEDFVVLGSTPPAGSRSRLGALVLGQYDDEGRLVYVGRVGSGFDEAGLAEAARRLSSLGRKTPLIRPVPRDLSDVRWVRPALVVEVRFSEWTPDRKLRAPVFVCFRDDKEAGDCHLGLRQTDLETIPEEKPNGPPDPDEVVAPKLGATRLVLTNLEKVFWPEDGYTKGDLIQYYTDIEETLSPYLQDRPLVLKRYPDGIHGEYFYQKDAPDHIPDWVRTEQMWSEETRRNIRYFVGCDRGLLPFLANLGGITQNPWSSRIGHLDRPDYVIFDLDPVEGVEFRSVQKVALELNAVLGELELRAYPKTSGATGIHVHLPLLEDQFSYADVRTFAEAIATIVVSRLPALATVERAVSRRPRAVYVDYLQNVKGKTVASVYSPRARPGAPVSTPLRWAELKRALHPGRYTMKTILRRLARVGDLWAPVAEDRQDITPFLRALGN